MAMVLSHLYADGGVHHHPLGGARASAGHPQRASAAAVPMDWVLHARLATLVVAARAQANLGRAEGNGVCSAGGGGDTLRTLSYSDDAHGHATGRMCIAWYLSQCTPR